ncbi:hypothetical protein LX87_05187 [Larkinella arboricola]|uniref:Uncharacterized protein n=1 Tax=Larkinella arboricola TaxID=643671 RepID=A0A327WKS0_LARAB|nr:hypothetical protein [Larkinella arboricola]RAJ92219.1 hypothetical protein LX87_05187 [Larkinella arboricola]
MAKTTALQRMKKALKIDENKLDKYLAYYHENAKLSADDQLMLEKYRKAWSFLSLGHTYDMTLAMLMKDYKIQERQARYIIAEASYLYGSIQTIDKQAKKMASANYFRLLSNIARANGDIEAASRAWERADKLEGLHEADQVGLNPDDFLRAAKFVFTDNINVLINQQKRADDE